MNWNWGHSPPFQGGVAARLQEMAPFLDWRSRGGSYPTHNHPGRSLERRGMPRFQFIHTFSDRPALIARPYSRTYRQPSFRGTITIFGGEYVESMGCRIGLWNRRCGLRAGSTAGCDGH